MKYEIEIAEKIVARLMVEAESPEQALQKAQETPRWEFDSVERLPDSMRVLNNALPWYSQDGL